MSQGSRVGAFCLTKLPLMDCAIVVVVDSFCSGKLLHCCASPRCSTCFIYQAGDSPTHQLAQMSPLLKNMIIDQQFFVSISFASNVMFYSLSAAMSFNFIDYEIVSNSTLCVLLRH